MTAKHTQAVPRVAGSLGWTAQLADYYDLTKPTIVWLIVMSTAVGCFLAADGSLAAVETAQALLATALLAAGTGALNQWSERREDSLMRRTRLRPIPAGRISPKAAFGYSAVLISAGLVYLLLAVNALCFWVGVVTVVSYNFVYTPLKTRTWWSTALGAVPGAMPALMGWAAMQGSLGPRAWVLFSILFFWQFPHFYAIAWMYREDYARAEIRMLPVIEPSGESTHRQILATQLLLVPASMAPAWTGLAAGWYAPLALLLSGAYLAAGVRLARSGSAPHAKDLLKASVFYLPLLYALLVIARP